MPQSKPDVEQTASEIRAWLASLEPGLLGDPNAGDLRAIGEARLAGAEAEVRLHEAVDAARQNGRTWTEVAAILGISRQAAAARFSVLRVLYTDPDRFVARWMNIPGDQDNPPESLALASTEPNQSPRPGRYRRTGEVKDGRWVYQLAELT